MAEKLSAQRKTIQRDSTFMRDELKLPIGYEDSLHGLFHINLLQSFISENWAR